MTTSPEYDPRRAGTIWVLNLDVSCPVVEPSISVGFRRITPDLVTELALSILGPESIHRLNA